MCHISLFFCLWFTAVNRYVWSVYNDRQRFAHNISGDLKCTSFSVKLKVSKNIQNSRFSTNLAIFVMRCWQLPFTIQLSSKESDWLFKRTLFSNLSTTLFTVNKIRQNAMELLPMMENLLLQ
jgi:hypothetical protein